MQRQQEIHRQKVGDLLSDFDFNREEVLEILNLAQEIKKKPGKFFAQLKNKTLALYFERPSTRTRVSFEVAMTELGGHAIYLDTKTTLAAKGELLSDMARVLSRYCQGLVARLYKQSDLEEMAKVSTIPVINGLTDEFHPCQILGDILTVKEKLGKLEGKIAFVGDCNFNIAHSIIISFPKIGMDVNLVCPKKGKYIPDPKLLKKAKKEGLGKIKIFHNPDKGVKDTDIIYTDIWTSPGQETESKQRLRDFKPYQVNSKLLKNSPKAKIMHCLPANRGFEITDEVLDGKNSIVFDQTENRLHIQKAILLKLLKS